MESMGEFEGRDVMINELAQGRELAKQLQKLLLDPSVSIENRELLMDHILSIYNKALTFINFNGGHRNLVSPVAGSSPVSSRSSDHDEDKLRPFKKRKTLARRAEKVKMSNGEELPNDGYSWRKYGQKIIHGAKFRRGYYRCTHRDSQGCSALKQVQRSDEDPTISHVIYMGDHSCNTSSHLTRPSTNKSPPRVHSMPTQPPHVDEQIQSQSPQPSPPPFQPQLTVQTQNLDNGDQEKFYFRCFSFSTAVIESDGASPTGWLLPESSTTSCSDHFQTSPGNINTPESDFGQNSDENLPEFSLEELGIIDPNFSFDNTDMFS